MKNALRKQMVELRSSLTQEQALVDSKIIIDKAVTYLRSINANNILIYMDMQKEVMATLLLDYDFNIYITKTLKDNTLKINKYIKEELIKHPFGYFESRSEDYIDGNNIDAIIIPGVAFDTKGNRVGYGKGYYDRLLAQYPNIPRIAVAYDFQVIDSQIETNEFDKKMTMIITEKRSIIL